MPADVCDDDEDGAGLHSEEGGGHFCMLPAWYAICCSGWGNPTSIIGIFL